MKGLAAIIICAVVAAYGYVYDIKPLQIIGITGFIGAGTNRIAIKMLFKRIHIFGVKVPFSGVIPENRKKITDSIVDLIENQLFTSKAIRAYINKNPELIGNLVSDGQDRVDDLIDRFAEDTIKRINTTRFRTKVKGMLPQDSLMLDLADAVGLKTKDEISQDIVKYIVRIIRNRGRGSMREALSKTAKSGIKKITVDSIVESVQLVPITEIATDRINSFSDDEIRILVENASKDHLGWLEVWGAVLGAICGLAMYLSMRT